jgi:hypothetical protein
MSYQLVYLIYASVGLEVCSTAGRESNLFISYGVPSCVQEQVMLDFTNADTYYKNTSLNNKPHKG